MANSRILIATILVLNIFCGISNIYASYLHDPNMTQFGPKLSEKELASIAKLSKNELIEMLETGDTLHKYAALKELKTEAHGGLKNNFDLLLKISEESRIGNMIVEGLIKSDIISDSNDDKLMVDKYLDFLEKQLNKEKPTVSGEQAIRSIGQCVQLPMKVRPTSPMHSYTNQIEIPYGTDRAIDILIKFLDSKDQRTRVSAINWLANIGANDLSKMDKVISALEAQPQKEDKFNEENIEGIKTVISDSIKELKKNIKQLYNIKY